MSSINGLPNTPINGSGVGVAVSALDAVDSSTPFSIWETASIQALRDERLRLSLQVASLEADKQRLAEGNQKLEEEKQGLAAENQKLVEHAAEMQVQYQSRFDILKQSEKELNECVSAAHALRMRADATAEVTQQDSFNLQRSLDSTLQELRVVQDTARSLDEDNERLVLQLAEIRQKHGEAEATKESLEKELLRAREKNTELEQSLSALSTSMASLHSFETLRDKTAHVGSLLESTVQQLDDDPQASAASPSLGVAAECLQLRMFGAPPAPCSRL